MPRHKTAGAANAGQPVPTVIRRGIPVPAGKALNARPTERLTPAVVERLLDLAQSCLFIESLASVAGIPTRVLRLWIRRGQEAWSTIDGQCDSPERAMACVPEQDRLYAALAAGLEGVFAERETNMALSIISAGQSDWRALAWMLERWRPQRWSETVRKEINAAERIDLSTLSEEELDQRLQAMMASDHAPEGEETRRIEIAEGETNEQTAGG